MECPDFARESSAALKTETRATGLCTKNGWRLLIVVLTLAAQPLFGGAEPAGAEAVKSVTAVWIKARLETSRLETEWRTDRQLLESTVNTLTDRAQTLESKRDYLQARTAKDREELSVLAATEKSALADVKEMEERARALSTRLLKLRASLPPRLSAALEMSYRSLSAASLAVGERIQLNSTVLNRCAQFNRTITCEEELLDLERGSPPRLVEVLYWGLGQAYAMDHTNSRTWRGKPGSEGWTWDPLSGPAEPIAALIAIYRDKAVPDFVTLPAQIRNGSSPAPSAGTP